MFYYDFIATSDDRSTRTSDFVNFVVLPNILHYMHFTLQIKNNNSYEK